MRNAGEHDWYDEPVPENVMLGEGSWLYSSFAFLHVRSDRAVAVRVGRRSGVYHPTVFDLGPEGSVEIGDYCTIAGPLISTNGRVTIGSFSLVSSDVVLADSPFAVPPGGRAARGRSEASEAIEIGENAWIGMRAILLAGARVGEGAIVGAATVVASEVPPYAVVAGNPARVVGWSKAAASG